MNARIAVLLVATSLRQACNPDDEAESGGEDGLSQQAHDEQVCQDGPRELFERGCPAGFGPRVHHGSPISVALIEDVATTFCGGMGYLIESEAKRGAEWIGYEITQNSACVFGCFAPDCPDGQDLCFGVSRSGAICSICSRDIDEQSCRDFVLGCHGIDPDDVDTGGDACPAEPGGDEATNG